MLAVISSSITFDSGSACIQYNRFLVESLAWFSDEALAWPSLRAHFTKIASARFGTGFRVRSYWPTFWGDMCFVEMSPIFK